MPEPRITTSSQNTLCPAAARNLRNRRLTLSSIKAVCSATSLHDRSTAACRRVTASSWRCATTCAVSAAAATASAAAEDTNSDCTAGQASTTSSSTTAVDTAVLRRPGVAKALKARCLRGAGSHSPGYLVGSRDKGGLNHKERRRQGAHRSNSTAAVVCISSDVAKLRTLFAACSFNCARRVALSCATRFMWASAVRAAASAARPALALTSCATEAHGTNTTSYQVHTARHGAAVQCSAVQCSAEGVCNSAMSAAYPQLLALGAAGCACGGRPLFAPMHPRIPPASTPWLAAACDIAPNVAASITATGRSAQCHNPLTSSNEDIPSKCVEWVNCFLRNKCFCCCGVPAMSQRIVLQYVQHKGQADRIRLLVAAGNAAAAAQPGSGAGAGAGAEAAPQASAWDAAKCVQWKGFHCRACAACERQVNHVCV